MSACSIYADSLPAENGFRDSAEPDAAQWKDVTIAPEIEGASTADAQPPSDVLVPQSDAADSTDVEAGSGERTEPDAMESGTEAGDVRIEIIADIYRADTLEAAPSDGPPEGPSTIDAQKDASADTVADGAHDQGPERAADSAAEPAQDSAPETATDARPPTLGFSVEYKAVNVNGSANAIQAELTVVDSGPNTVPVEELTLRYYFTNEVAEPLVIDIGFTGLNPGFIDLAGFVTKQVVRMATPTSTADSYIELGYRAGAPTIGPGQSVIVAWQFHNGSYANLNQVNDYSFDPSKTSAATWDRVVLVRAGAVIWGTPP